MVFLVGLQKDTYGLMRVEITGQTALSPTWKDRDRQAGSALLTDLYELTMAQSFLEHGKTGPAVFSIFTRSLPEKRNFLVAGGLEDLVHHLEQFRFSDTDIAYLRDLNLFSGDFLDYLSRYRFSGSLWAIPEGTIVFQNEPLVQIEGSLPDVQILETLALNCIHYGTLAASKAARIIAVSRGRDVVEFGFRRSHTPSAGIAAARAAYIAGFSGTSNLEAGRIYKIPVVGTMAHSYVMLFDSEEEAFRAYQTSFPERSFFLIDTYDTLSCADTVLRLAGTGVPVIGVRIDSGDIPELVRTLREKFDREGFPKIRIFVSGNVDEYGIDQWLSSGLPIDSFGVGTHFVTSSDAPYLDMVYKLVEYEGTPRYKTSPGKQTFPYKRQVVRHTGNGMMKYDEVVRMTGHTDEGLVREYIRDGQGITSLPEIPEIRARCAEGLRSLPESFRTLTKQEFSVRVLP